MPKVSFPLTITSLINPAQPSSERFREDTLVEITLSSVGAGAGVPDELARWGGGALACPWAAQAALAFASFLMMPADRRIVIVDMDGTLADVSHRLHYLNGPTKNWSSFFAFMDDDPPSTVIVDWVKNLPPDYEVVIVTGRPEKFRANTESWLRKYDIPYSRIIMRRSGDHRPDYVVKKELLDQVGQHSVAFVIDDRPTVCEMWRSCGLHVIPITHGPEYK
jgi:hypothetical protein